jgi:hypothetical protein
MPILPWLHARISPDCGLFPRENGNGDRGELVAGLDGSGLWHG